MAQWYPRVTVFSDYEGWHNKEFIGNGEFTLEFGDFEVDISVPSDHVVSATGVLLNRERCIESSSKKENEASQKI